MSACGLSAIIMGYYVLSLHLLGIGVWYIFQFITGYIAVTKFNAGFRWSLRQRRCFCWRRELCLGNIGECEGLWSESRVKYIQARRVQQGLRALICRFE